MAEYTIDTYRDGGTVAIGVDGVETYCINRVISFGVVGAVHPGYPTKVDCLQTIDECDAAMIVILKALPSFRSPNEVIMIGKAIEWLGDRMQALETENAFNFNDTQLPNGSNFSFEVFLDGGTVAVKSAVANTGYYIDMRLRSDAGAVFCCYPSSGIPINCMSDYVTAKRILTEASIHSTPPFSGTITKALHWLDTKMAED